MDEASTPAVSKPKEPGKDFLVVGLGGSAGAIPAFREFFKHVPAESGMAFVVILHLSPEHDSKLAEILQASSVLPVMQVREQIDVKPDKVYVIPPNQSLTMEDGALVPSPIGGPEERRAPVDIFFRTLGEAHESRAVCVIMSISTMRPRSGRWSFCTSLSSRRGACCSGPPRRRTGESALLARRQGGPSLP